MREVGLWPEAAVRRDAAIFPVLDDKPTLRGDRECVEFDPLAVFGAAIDTPTGEP